MSNAPACPPMAVSPDDSGQYFVGYYDKQPWSADGGRLLAHRATFVDRVPGRDDEAEVGWITLADRRFEPIGRTTAWNWQQGAQLQWYDHAGAARLLYNVRRGDRLGAVVADEAGEHHAIDHPVYTVAGDGRWALTLNYARLAATRPDYGIAGLADPFAGAPMPEDDGVYRLDMGTGRRELIVSIARAASHRPNPMGAAARHWVNHLMINPSGTRVCFLHRFDRADGITHSRLFTAGADGGDLRLLIEGMVSHFDWIDDQTLLAWAGRRKLLGTGSGQTNPLLTAARKTLKPIYYALGKPRILMQKIVGDSYLILPDQADSPARPMAKGVLSCDGHCTISPDGRWVLTDGYYDRRHRQPLWLWDRQRQRLHEIGRYPTPAELDGPIRVDLHPRFGRDGATVCIDSAMEGRRRIYTLDVGPIVNAE